MARAAAGLAPPVDTATTSRPRLITEGRMKSQRAGSSAPLTQTERARPPGATARGAAPPPPPPSPARAGPPADDQAGAVGQIEEDRVVGARGHRLAGSAVSRPGA